VEIKSSTHAKAGMGWAVSPGYQKEEKPQGRTRWGSLKPSGIPQRGSLVDRSDGGGGEVVSKKMNIDEETQTFTMEPRGRKYQLK